jgi:hypothetical protein
MSSIIGGYNNTATSTCSSIIGQSISTCGSINTQGQAGYLIDWKDDMMKKYPRFIIKTEYDAMTFAPTNLITDTKTNKEYKFIPLSMSNIVNETDKYIQQLITIIRDEKLNTLINDSES